MMKNNVTVELWYDGSEKTMESVIRETGRVIISIPCPKWADKTTVAAVVRKETSRRVYR